jgi:hypothetical protein
MGYDVDVAADGKLGPQLIRTEPGVGHRLQPSADA